MSKRIDKLEKLMVEFKNIKSPAVSSKEEKYSKGGPVKSKSQEFLEHVRALLPHYDDGGSVAPSEDDTFLHKLSKSINDAMNPSSTPAPNVDSDRQNNYDKIRQQNRTNFDNPTSPNAYAHGGRVQNYDDGGMIPEDTGNFLPNQGQSPFGFSASAPIVIPDQTQTFKGSQSPTVGSMMGNIKMPTSTFDSANKSTGGGGSSSGGGGGGMSDLSSMASFFNKGGKVPNYDDGATPDDLQAALEDQDSPTEADPKQEAADAAEMAAAEKDHEDDPKENVDFDEDQKVVGGTPLKADEDNKPNEDAIEEDKMFAEDAKAGGQDKDDESDEDNKNDLKRDVASTDTEDDESNDGSDESDVDSDDSSADKKENAPVDQASIYRALAALNNSNNGGVGNLKDAQRQANQRASLQDMQRGAALMGAGLAHANPNAVIGNINKQQDPNAPIEQYQQQIADQGNEPDSPMSQTIANYAKSKGLAIPDGASGNAILKTLPFLAKDQALQTQLKKVAYTSQVKIDEDQKNREAQAQLQKDKDAEAMKRTQTAGGFKVSAAKAGQEAKMAKEGRDAEVKAESDLNSTRGKQALMMAQKNMMAVKNAQRMLQEFPDTDKWTSSQVNLFNTELVKIASTGVPTESQLSELSNPTAAMSASKLASKITNVPVGAQQGKFIALNKQYLDGLGEVSKKVITENLGNTLKSYEGKLSPESYKNMLYRHSDMLGLYTPKEEQGISAVVNSKGISRQEAIRALIKAKKIKDVNY